MTTTPFLGLSSTSGSSGLTTTFLDWRQLQDGISSSNAITIDTWASETSASVVALDDNAVLDQDYNANTILAATSDDTPIALEIPVQTIVGRITAGNIDALTATEVRTLINVADGADVTASNAPQAHKNSHDPEDGSDLLDTAAPAELASVQAAGIGSSHSFARADHAHQIQESMADNHIVTVNDADAADADFVKFTATGGVAGRSAAETRTDLGIDTKQMWIGNAKPTVTAPCADQARIELGTNDNVYDYLSFDATTIEYAYANVALPLDYDAGTITATFYWMHPATTTNFKVAWGLQAVAIADDGAMDVAQGTIQYTNDTGGTTSDLYISPATSAITMGGSPAAGNLVQFRIQRYATDATNDTLAVDAYLLGVQITYGVS